MKKQITIIIAMLCVCSYTAIGQPKFGVYVTPGYSVYGTMEGGTGQYTNYEGTPSYAMGTFFEFRFGRSHIQLQTGLEFSFIPLECNTNRHTFSQNPNIYWNQNLYQVTIPVLLKYVLFRKWKPTIGIKPSFNFMQPLPQDLEDLNLPYENPLSLAVTTGLDYTLYKRLVVGIEMSIDVTPAIADFHDYRYIRIFWGGRIGYLF